MKNYFDKYFNAKVIFSIVIAYLFSQFILLGLPARYIFGFLGLALLVFIFLKSPLNFLCLLLLFRGAIDNLLVNIRFNFAGIDLGFGGAVSLFIIIAAVFYILTAGKVGVVLKGPIVYLYSIFILLSIVVFFFTSDKASGFKILIRYCSILSIFVLTISLVDSELKATKVIRSIVLSALVTLFFGIIHNTALDNRFAATFGHPNILAYYLLIIISCLLLRFDICKTNENNQSLTRLIFFVSVLALIFTQTRSGWLAFFIIIILYTFYFSRRLIVPIIVISAFLCFIPLVTARLANLFLVHSGHVTLDKMNSLSWRLEKWSYLFSAFLKKPFTGYGFNAATNFGKDYLGAHNDYLRFLVESGIFGCLFYFLPYFYLLKHVTNHRKQFMPETVLQKLCNFFMIFLPAFLIMSFSENLAAYIAVHWYLWTLIGIYFALYYRTKIYNRDGRNLAD